MWLSMPYICLLKHTSEADTKCVKYVVAIFFLYFQNERNVNTHNIFFTSEENPLTRK